MPSPRPATLLTGVLVSLSGAIGFVGLMLPHVIRFNGSHVEAHYEALIENGNGDTASDALAARVTSHRQPSLPPTHPRP